MNAVSGPEAARSPTAEALEAVTNALRARDFQGAKARAKEALAGGLEHPLFLNLRALEHEDEGRLDDALADLRRAHFLSPQDFAILNACGLCLARMDRFDEASQCYDQAIALNPDFEQAWFNSGWVLERLGETGKARDRYARTVELNPKHVPAWASMSYLAARRGETDAAREYVHRALELQPGQPTATLALADLEMGDPPTAERILRELLADNRIGDFDRAAALGQLGDVLNAQGRIAEAFSAYVEGNALFMADAKAKFEAPGQTTVADTAAWLIEWGATQKRATPQPTRPPAAHGAGAVGHVFLIGFPRSGTTLLESVLTAHPMVVSLEERSTLQASVRAFMRDKASLATLSWLSEAQRRSYMDDYWSCVRAFGAEVDGKIFIDKNPFNTLKLPLIHGLFPDARIIFAVRDPRDVVFSAFRRRFNLNPSTYELLDIVRTAKFYSNMMIFAELFRRNFNIAEHFLVYEKLVADLPGEARQVCEFIGADWRPHMADFASRAKRGDVASASSAQIARGLYTDGAGQWRRYREQLAPVLPLLAPWVERFGYPAD